MRKYKNAVVAKSVSASPDTAIASIQVKFVPTAFMKIASTIMIIMMLDSKKSCRSKRQIHMHLRRKTLKDKTQKEG